MNVIQKPLRDFNKKVSIMSPADVNKLEEVNTIRSAIQEHLLFIGLDRVNNIRTINVLGIGNSSSITFNAKEILRTALLTASDNVILVHNHPSNRLKASYKDILTTNKLSKYLSLFKINLLDHVIVTENEYESIMSEMKMDNKYQDEDIELVSNVILTEENERLKVQINRLTEELESYKGLLNEENSSIENNFQDDEEII